MTKLAHHLNHLTELGKRAALQQTNGRFIKVLELDRGFLLEWKKKNPNGLVGFR